MSILWESVLTLRKYAIVFTVLSYFYEYGFMVFYFIRCITIYDYHYLFGYSSCSQFGQWGPIQAGFYTPLKCSCYSSLSQDVSVSSCIFPAPLLKLAICLGVQVSFTGEWY